MFPFAINMYILRISTLQSEVYLVFKINKDKNAS